MAAERPCCPGSGWPAASRNPPTHEPLINYLNTVLRFVGVRPGSAADRVGLVADLVIDAHPNPAPLVLRQLPDIAFLLQAEHRRPDPRGSS